MVMKICSFFLSKSFQLLGSQSFTSKSLTIIRRIRQLWLQQLICVVANDIAVYHRFWKDKVHPNFQIHPILSVDTVGPLLGCHLWTRLFTLSWKSIWNKLLSSCRSSVSHQIRFWLKKMKQLYKITLYFYAHSILVISLNEKEFLFIFTFIFVPDAWFIVTLVKIL